MSKINKSGSKMVILAVVSAAVLAAPSAFAGAVTNYTGTDGFSAEPYIQGTNILHVRLDQLSQALPRVMLYCQDLTLQQQ